jgi:hypothetical protein
MDKPFQRIGSKSNAHVGRDFEIAAKEFFSCSGIELVSDLKVPVGVGSIKKEHAFDLGCKTQKIIVECKSHRWTSGDNVPSAKMTVWNEAMYYFQVAPKEYRKIMFVLKDMSAQRNKTLAEYYLRTYNHLVPCDVEFWEYDEIMNNAERLALNN